MSTSPDADLDLDQLFLPDWAKKSPDYNRFADYRGGGDEERGSRYGGDRRGPPGNRPPRRDRPPRPQGGPGRPSGPGGGASGQGQGPRRWERRGDDRSAGRGPMRDRPEPRPELPLPDLEVSFIPEERGVESLAKQIRMTGRAYPVFDIAQMILQRPERHHLAIDVVRKPDGAVAQPMFVCALDDTLWLSEEEAVRHLLDRHFNTFYQTEKSPMDPPKGTYTFVAQCGMSGVVLGPPNYHDYQNRLHRLHAERFSKMPFDMFKSRVRIVRDEAVVKKWLDELSWKISFVCLNMPEPLKLETRDDVEKHFNEVHRPNLVRQVETHKLSGVAARDIRSPGLQRLLRRVLEDQRRFPLSVVGVLSQQFASHGLQFFKVNKTVTHVCVARPHYLDLTTTPVSEGVKRIVDFINAHPRCTRRKLVESLAPTPPAPPAPAVIEIAPAPAAAAEGAPAPAAPVPQVPPPTPEQTAVIGDLHWLIHQGHVIEFATGVLETAKKPLPKPPSPPKPKAAAPKPATPVPATTAAEAPAEGATALMPASAEAEAASAAEPAVEAGPIGEATNSSPSEPASAEVPAVQVATTESAPPEVLPAAARPSTESPA